MERLTILCAVLTMLGPPMVSAQVRGELTSKQIYAKWARSVVTIRTKNGSGTGFFDSEGNLYTAYHVIKGTTSVSVVFSDGLKAESSWVKAADPSTDIAILVTSDYKGREKRELGPELGQWAACKVGDKATVIGSPLELAGTLTEGLVSAKRQESVASYLQLSASVSPGSSGSPVFNTQGKVVGMVVKELTAGQNLNFAVSSKDLRDAWCVPLSLVSAQDVSSGKSQTQKGTWPEIKRREWASDVSKLLLEAKGLFSRMDINGWRGSTTSTESLVANRRKYWAMRLDGLDTKQSLAKLVASGDLEGSSVNLFMLYDSVWRTGADLSEASNYDDIGQILPKLGGELSIALVALATKVEKLRHDGFFGIAQMLQSGTGGDKAQQTLPSLKNIVLSDQETAGTSKASFGVNTQRIFVYFDYEGVPVGTKLTGAWFCVTSKVAPPNYKIDDAALIVKSESSSGSFSLSKPTNGWPPGAYRVEISADGTRLAAAEFEIE